MADKNHCLFFALYPTFVSLLITLIMGTFIATIYTKLKLFSYTFFENLKILIVCAALPTLISVIVQLALPFLMLPPLFCLVPYSYLHKVSKIPKIQLKKMIYAMFNSLNMAFSFFATLKIQGGLAMKKIILATRNFRDTYVEQMEKDYQFSCTQRTKQLIGHK